MNNTQKALRTTVDEHAAAITRLSGDVAEIKAMVAQLVGAPVTPSLPEPKAGLWNCCQAAPAGVIRFDNGEGVFACASCLSTVPQARREALAPRTVNAEIAHADAIVADIAPEAPAHLSWTALRVALRNHKAAGAIPAGVSAKQAVEQGLMDRMGNLA
jgi:hypothetical protein